MKRNIVLLLVVFFIGESVFAAHINSEKTYQQRWCNAHNGILEYKLDDKTRVDCLTDTLAVEVDFAPKWHECIGQALYYGRKTKRTPACVLIIENPEKDLKYLKRLRYSVYQKKAIPQGQFRTFTIKPEGI